MGAFTRLADLLLTNDLDTALRLVDGSQDTNWLHPDITNNLTVGYTTDVESVTFTTNITPDFTGEYLKLLTVTADFTLEEPTGNGHTEYLITVTGSPTPGYWVVSPGTDVTIFGANNRLYPGVEYSLNVRKFSDTDDTIAQLIQVSNTGLYATVTQIDNTDSPYSIATSDVDSVIYADSTSGAITINLPSGGDERVIRVKNKGTGGNLVTLDPSGSGTIEDDLGNFNSNVNLSDGTSLAWIFLESDDEWNLT